MVWLVFTHGAGPMREYAIGVVLLDSDEPERLIAALPEPLLVADEPEREGYVWQAITQRDHSPVTTKRLSRSSARNPL